MICEYANGVECLQIMNESDDVNSPRLNSKTSYNESAQNSNSENTLGGELTLLEAKEVVEEFVNDYLMPDGSTARITDISGEHGLYKVIIDIETDILTAYLTKSGKYFFPDSFDLEDLLKNRNFTNEELTLDEAKKISKQFIDTYLTKPDIESNIIGMYGAFHANDDALYRLKVATQCLIGLFNVYNKRRGR
jgi:hypothetical protein